MSLGVKISQIIYLSNLNIYSNFTLFLFLSWHSHSKHSSNTVIFGVLFPLLFSYLFQTQLQCFFQNTDVSISYLTYLSSDSLLPWHSYYLSSYLNTWLFQQLRLPPPCTDGSEGVWVEGMACLQCCWGFIQLLSGMLRLLVSYSSMWSNSTHCMPALGWNRPWSWMQRTWVVLWVP